MVSVTSAAALEKRSSGRGCSAILAVAHHWSSLIAAAESVQFARQPRLNAVVATVEDKARVEALAGMKPLVFATAAPTKRASSRAEIGRLLLAALRSRAAA